MLPGCGGGIPGAQNNPAATGAGGDQLEGRGDLFEREVDVPG
jgi:hypothetical protein